MQIKQNKIIKAYQATDKFVTHETIPLELKWKLYNLRKILGPFYEFQAEQESTIRKKYAQYADKNGEIAGQVYSDFLSELEGMANLDMNIDIPEKIQITLTDKSIFTVQDIEALDCFVDFVFRIDDQHKEK